jgi:glycosyltransferase involved in cell wall biosynthesis
MKHIVIIGKYYPPEFGGVERITRDVARIAAKVHRVTVVVHNKAREDRIEQDGNITIVRCGTAKTISSQPISVSMLGHLRSLKPDLVHFNAPNFWGAAMLSLARYKTPLIIHHHADVFGRPLLRRALMPIYRRIASDADCIIVNSLKIAAASKDLPREGCRFVEIPSGVDGGRYRLDPNERAALLAERRQRFGDAPVVGFIGRFVRYKALPVLVEAVSRVNSLQALLIGDGPLRAEIEQRVRAAGIAERVHFLGNLGERDKIRAMGMMDMLTLPSNDPTEAFGIVQVEAQLMRLPVVASRLATGVTDVTLDEITGLLVPPNDAGALADAFCRLLRDQMLAERLGTAGLERALRFFTVEVFENRLSTLLHAVLSGTPFDELTAPFLTSSDAPTNSPVISPEASDSFQPPRKIASCEPWMD